MNKDVQDKWVAALRSGTYRQGVGALNKNDKFCCFGVLCDLYVEENPGEIETNVGQVYGDRITYDGRDALAPVKVLDWAGMEDEYGTLPSGTTCLTELNDGGFSFNQIADLIEFLGDSL